MKMIMMMLVVMVVMVRMVCIAKVTTTIGDGAQTIRETKKTYRTMDNVINVKSTHRWFQWVYFCALNKGFNVNRYQNQMYSMDSYMNIWQLILYGYGKLDLYWEFSFHFWILPRILIHLRILMTYEFTLKMLSAQRGNIDLFLNGFLIKLRNLLLGNIIASLLMFHTSCKFLIIF